MKAGWQIRPLGEVCKLLNGRAYNKDELLAEGSTPVLRVGNFFTNRNWYYSDLTLDEDKYCDDGDLLYAWSASFGPRIWQGGRVIYHYHIWKTQPNPDLLDKKFLFHFLDWDKENIKAAQGAGTTMIHVTKGSMEARLMPVPPLDEQRRIVAVLDKAFANIATATANAQKNLTNARALFESYVQAIFAGREKGWTEYSFDQICSISSKLVDPRLPAYLDLPHIGAGNMESRTGGIIDVLTAREEGLKSGKFLFDASMVLYSKIRPYLMKACRPEFSGLCSADVYPLVPKAGLLDRDMLFHILMSDEFTAYAEAGSARAGMPKVNREHLFKYSVWLPDVATQRLICRKLDELSSKCQDLANVAQSKLAALTELKQSLLHKAFAGELT